MLDKSNWDKLSLKVYAEIYKEAKERYDDLLSESQSLTDKATKLTILLFGLAGWTSSFVFKIKAQYCVVVIGGGLLLWLIWLLLKLLFPKYISARGTSPARIFDHQRDLIDPDDSEEQRDKTFFYHQINRYRMKIEKLGVLNASRGKEYKRALILSFVLLIFVSSVFYYSKMQQ